MVAICVLDSVGFAFRLGLAQHFARDAADLPIDNRSRHIQLRLDLLADFSVWFGCLFRFQPGTFLLNRGFYPLFVPRGRIKRRPAALRAALPSLVIGTLADNSRGDLPIKFGLPQW